MPASTVRAWKRLELAPTEPKACTQVPGGIVSSSDSPAAPGRHTPSIWNTVAGATTISTTGFPV